MLTLGDVKADRGIQRIASYCTSSDDFISLVNEAQRSLLRRGDWAGTVVPIFLCMRAGCVVWPRYVQTVRALSWCHHPIKPLNMWGDFLPRASSCGWRHGVQWQHGQHCQSAMVAQGRSSVFQDIQGDGRLVRAYLRCNADIGKTVTIFGTDNNGQPLQTQQPDHSWTMGLVLTLAVPFASTNTFVRHIDYVLKDATQCPINLFAYNASLNVLEELAQYDPDETRPSYERTKIQMHSQFSSGCGAGSCCGTDRGVAALVKLRFIEARNDTDLIILDNLDALKLMMQSIKFGEAGDRQNRKLYEADAIEILNRQLEEESPDDQFVAEDAVFAGHTFSNHAF